MTLARLSRVLFALAVPAVLALVGPRADAYARTLAYGRRILEQHAFGTTLGREVFGGVGSPAGAFAWLDAVVVALAHAAFGDAGAFVLAALAATVVVALVVASARARGSGATCALLAGALAFVCSLGALRVGGSGLAWAACAVFAVASARATMEPEARRARTWIALAIGAALAWCELSAFGIAAPLLALADAVGITLVAGAAEAQTKRAWTIALGAALATLCTPGGLAFPGLAFTQLGFDRDALRPLALHPIDIDALGYRNGFVLIAIALAVLGLPRARRGTDAWPVLLALVLALENGALLPLFAIVVTPMLASAASDALAASSTREPAKTSFAFDPLPWLAAIPAALVVWFVAHDRAVPASAATIASAPLYARTLQQDALVHRIVCERPERCGDIVALGDPHLRVLMDARVPAYPEAVRTLQTDFTGLKGAWLAPLVRGGADALVVESAAHVDVVLGLGREWKRVGADDRVAIYRRSQSERAR